MTTHDKLHARDALPAAEPAAPFSSWIRSMGQWLVAWADTCADHWAAAAMYEQLSALSDAELSRRGLSRATLAQDICGASRRLAYERRNHTRID
jgi:hypothetical protein